MPSGHPPTQEGHGTMRPTGLVEGARAGDWRVLWRYGTGGSSVVHLAVRAGDEAAGPYALKLALRRGDARFGREAELLERVRHPNVPRLQGYGEWHGLPYVVMDWVEGAALYRWARLCNPSRRQVMGLLAKVAGALAAVHSMGGTHRDVKGDNVLVRLSDGAPMLMDFGAGTWEGAAPLTVGGPPGTPLYYSPERLRFHLGLLPPEAPSGAGPTDDVYALGVTAFRLLTDSYPFLEVEEAQRTQERLAGKPPCAPHALNPGVSPELGSLVLRMMAAQSEERPSAHEVARALEALASQQAEELLFAWATEPDQLSPGLRHPSGMQYELWLARARIEEAQARVAAEVARIKAQPRIPPLPEPQPKPPPQRESLTARRAQGRRAAVQGLWLAVACAVLLAAALWPGGAPPDEQPAPLVQQAQETRDAGTTGLGDTSLPAPTRVGPLDSAREDIGAEMPKEPMPGQLRSPCKRSMVEINGGCWTGPIEGESAPCGNKSYEWKNQCYWPVAAPRQPTTSEPP